MEKNRETFYTPELYRLLGEVILAESGGTPRAGQEAEIQFRRALDLARSTANRWLQLRSAVSLHRLLRGTKRHDESLALLRGVYDSFTEGFDTRLLKSARELLEEPDRLEVGAARPLPSAAGAPAGDVQTSR